jgi:enoyl-CoA hydratase/carnithine racemase
VTQEFSDIRYDVADGVATITLHRPEKLNAFTLTMCRELVAAADLADADDAVRVVLLTGAGRAFCAGADWARARPPSTRTPTATSPTISDRSAGWRATGAASSPCASPRCASP